MSKQNELIKNTLILTIGKICTQFISFLLLPLYTTLLTPDQYGIVDLFNTYIMILVPTFNWQFQNGLFRFLLDCRGDYKQQKKIISTVLTSNLVQSMVYLVMFLIAQYFIKTEYKIFLAINVILSILLNTLLQMSRGIGNNGAYAVASFISAIFNILLNILFIAIYHFGALGLFYSSVISTFITILYLSISQKIWLYYKVYIFDKKYFLEIARYSIPLIPNELSWWVVGVSDRLIVSYAINIAANGIYSVANKFSSIFIVFYNVFSMSWAESVTLHINDEDRDIFLSGVINTMFCLFSSLCLGVIACMPFIFPILVNIQYRDAYFHIPILMLSVLFQIVIGLYSAIYVALKKTKDIAKTSLYAAIINIVVNLILIKWVGLYAASISTLAAYMVMAIYRYFDVKKYLSVIIKKNVLISTTLIGIFIIAIYYINNIIMNIGGLIIVIVYSVLINKDFLLSLLKICKEFTNNYTIKHGGN